MFLSSNGYENLGPEGSVFVFPPLFNILGMWDMYMPDISDEKLKIIQEPFLYHNYNRTITYLSFEIQARNWKSMYGSPAQSKNGRRTESLASGRRM